MFFPPDIEPGIFCFSGKYVNNNTKVPLIAVSLSLQILSIKGTCYTRNPQPVQKVRPKESHKEDKMNIMQDDIGSAKVEVCIWGRVIGYLKTGIKNDNVGHLATKDGKQEGK